MASIKRRTIRQNKIIEFSGVTAPPPRIRKSSLRDELMLPLYLPVDVVYAWVFLIEIIFGKFSSE